MVNILIRVVNYNSLFMQPKSEVLQKTNLLYNWEAIKLYLPYLKLSDMISSCTVSKEWQYSLNKYLKEYFLPEQYTQLANDGFQAAKLVYNRKVLWREGNTVRDIEFPEICSKAEIGHYVTKFETLEGNTYIVRNDRLATITRKDWKDSSIVYKLQAKFSSARCVGPYLYLVADSQIVRYVTTPQNMFSEELPLQFKYSIDHVITSISSVLVVMGTSKKGSQYAFFTHKDPLPKKFVIPVPIDNPETDLILDYGLHGFIISSQGTLFQTEFMENEAKISEIKALKGRTVAKLKTGFKHYFAYERKKKLTKKWSNAEVLEWAEQEGFSDYVKILQRQKVTGEKLLTMNKAYMQDVLGMTSTLSQQKMNLLIHESNRNSDNFEDYIVHCWGKNDKGQLCTNPSANITNIIKLKIPENTELFACFGDSTVLLNKKSNELTINSLDENGKLQWQHLTNNKVWALAGYKQWMVLCESVGKKRVPQSLTEEIVHVKKEKLRTAKNIMDKIQWDGNLKKEEFAVGYETRYQGTVECGFEEFMLSDVKENSILYFKRKGKLVWDKKARFDIL